MIKVVDIVDSNISKTNPNGRIIYTYYSKYNIEKRISKRIITKYQKTITFIIICKKNFLLTNL